MFAGRRERLFEQVQDEKLDALLITHPVNVAYLTGFTGDSSCLVLTPARALLVSDARFTAQIAEECPGLDTFIRPPVQTLGEATSATLAGLGLKVVGFESNHLSVAEFSALGSRGGG